MKRWIFGLLALGALFAVDTTQAQAGEWLKRLRQDRQKYPPKWERTSNAWNYVYRDREGQVKVREVYPGYADRFPTPALFYYGYPHSGDDTGLGIYRRP